MVAPSYPPPMAPRPRARRPRRRRGRTHRSRSRRATSRTTSAATSSPGSAASPCSPGSRSCSRSRSRAAGSARARARCWPAGSRSALLGVGVWLREHRDRTEAAVAAAAVGIAGLFGTLVVAGPVYELIPRPVALLGAFGDRRGRRRRWRSAGARRCSAGSACSARSAAPVALGALDGGGIVFLAVAFAATIAVLVWQRWTALAGRRVHRHDAAVARVAAVRRAWATGATIAHARRSSAR